ncbi:hypothetical protein CsSME_00009986 [Camellia sinensis var. sinensis]
MRDFHMSAATTATRVGGLRAEIQAGRAFSIKACIATPPKKNLFMTILAWAFAVVEGGFGGNRSLAGKREPNSKLGLITSSIPALFAAAHPLTNVMIENASATLCEALTPTTSPPQSNMLT